MRIPVFILVMISAVCASVSMPAGADTLLASYEPSEVGDLTVGTNNLNDCTLT
jgi:hypothetical protein